MSAEHDTSTAWPAELLFLLERHPRATWPNARSASAAFWLEVHDHLRRDARGLEAAGDDYSRRSSSPSQLAVIAAPRLRGLIAAMHGHHQIEDFHYFPAFRRAQPKLAAGFDRLESEHAALARSVEAALGALAELHAAVERAADSAAATPQLAAARYVAAATELSRSLQRHLDDEENLVVPLLLETGDY